SAAGKQVRCPGCQKAVPVLKRPEPAAPSPPAAAAGAATGKEASPGRVAANRPASAMRCPACQAAAVQKLPPNAISRHPGYVCSACGAVMRPPGSTGLYLFLTVLGGVVVLLGLGVVVAVTTSEDFNRRALYGGVTLPVLGAVVAVWCINQLRLPIPLD